MKMRENLDAAPAMHDGRVTPGSLTTAVKAEAHRLDRDLVRCALATPPPPADALDPWLVAGNASELGYIACNGAKRSNPREVVAGAHSVISVSLQFGWEIAQGA